MSRKVRLSSMIVAVTGLLAIGPAAAAATGPAPAPSPIGQNQFFSGLVNGSDGFSKPAIIQTTCIGPVVPGETGHPLAGQTVEVTPALNTGNGNDLGYTGSATSIAASLGWPYPGAFTNLEPVAKFSSYFVQEPIAVTLTVPCGGTGAMVFAPVQGGTTGRSATVPVTFESQP